MTLLTRRDERKGIVQMLVEEMPRDTFNRWLQHLNVYKQQHSLLSEWFIAEPTMQIGSTLPLGHPVDNDAQMLISHEDKIEIDWTLPLSPNTLYFFTDISEKMGSATNEGIPK